MPSRPDRLAAVRRTPARPLVPYRVDTVQFASAVAGEVFTRVAICPDGAPSGHDINDLAKVAVVQVGVVMESIRGISSDNPWLVERTMAAIRGLTLMGEIGRGWSRRLAQSTLTLLDQAPEIYEACGNKAVGNALARARRTYKKHIRLARFAKERRHVVRQ